MERWVAEKKESRIKNKKKRYTQTLSETDQTLLFFCSEKSNLHPKKIMQIAMFLRIARVNLNPYNNIYTSFVEEIFGKLSGNFGKFSGSLEI